MAHRFTLERENFAVRLADLADHSRALGHHSRANRLLLLAWAAYDNADDQKLTIADLSRCLTETPCAPEVGRKTAQIYQFPQASSARSLQD